MRTKIFILSMLLFGVWALATGFNPEVGYVQLTWGAMALWCGILGVWILFRRRTHQNAGVFMRFVARVINLVMALTPGAILIAYGSLAPAAPSLTRGGFDVCDTSPGFCVSGTRAFIFFGIFLLIIGIITNWVVGLEVKKSEES